jgi:quercetin dioxygenase-like cupin family protein
MIGTTLKSIFALALGLLGTGALAQDPKALRLTPEEITTPQTGNTQSGTSGAAGMQMGVLSGGPKQPGLYTLFLKLPKGTVIKPHSHPDNRVAVVVSGTWYFAHGDTFDESQLKALPAGSFYTEPPGVNHYAMTKDDDVTVYVTGIGPTGTVYVNPTDDPSKKQ